MYTSYCPDLETTPSLCYKAYDKKFNKLSIRFKQFITRSDLMLWKVQQLSITQQDTIKNTEKSKSAQLLDYNELLIPFFTD